ncbi:hypothetical protein F2P56_008252 [Juglans regia]|uniref:Protein LURP-one-related 10-like n=2 Tax=Juglans regia TaxID=51240 RepID=A0A2I4EIR9_JUGRE|nr:protein LURP-one-related 10-like [Juglans regia]KAF5471464.1 hypothetical protein F2P56_008252 [Juglans regia]
MAQSIPAPAPTVAQFANPIPVICTQYCTPYTVDLAVVKKVMTISGGNFVVTDSKGTVIFYVKEKLMSLHDHRVLFHADGNPIVTLREKIMSAHHRWNVYRGKSKEPNDLIFTVKRSSMIQMRAKLHVFLANNTNEEVCDFMVEGSSHEKSCVVYTGDRTNIVAEMGKKTTVRSALFGKDNYSVTVHPNVDYAFIVALIVILDDMNHISDTDDLLINSDAEFTFELYEQGNGRVNLEITRGGDGGRCTGGWFGLGKYEKLYRLCFNCGRIVHDKESCKERDGNSDQYGVWLRDLPQMRKGSARSKDQRGSDYNEKREENSRSGSDKMEKGEESKGGGMEDVIGK